MVFHDLAREGDYDLWIGDESAGWCMDYQRASPAGIAAAIATEIGREVDYRPVATDGAARAAALLADLL
jgi:hypothetical protein